MTSPTPAPAFAHGPTERLCLIDELPVVPNDEPAKVHTHLTDSDAQRDVEHRRPRRRR